MKRLLLIVLVFCGIKPVLAQSLLPESYELNQCAIVQTGEDPRVFLTAPSGEVEALDVSTEKTLWKTANASYVFLARGDRLLAQLPAVARGGEGCGLAILDARNGKILKELPWPKGAHIGCVGSSYTASFSLEGFTQEGRDYLVSTYSWRPMVGGAYKGPEFKYPPGSSGSTQSAFLVDLALGTLTPVTGEIPDTRLKAKNTGGSDYQTEPFVVDDIRAQTVQKMVKKQSQMILRRWKGDKALPDVKLSEPPWNSCGIVVCADRRHVLGVYQVPGPNDVRLYHLEKWAKKFHKAPLSGKDGLFYYHVEVYSTVTGEKIGALDSTSWPATAQVCGNDLVAWFPNRVFALDLSTGKEAWTRPLKNMSYEGPMPPALRRPQSSKPQPKDDL